MKSGTECRETDQERYREEGEFQMRQREIEKKISFFFR